MQKKLEIVVIHGSGPQKPDYDAPFCKALLKYLEKKGPLQCKGRWSEIVNFRTVHYDHFGKVEKRELWQRIYPKPPGTLEFGFIRERLYDPIGDLLYYQSIQGGQQIRDTLRIAIAEAGRELRSDTPDWPMEVAEWQQFSREQAIAKWQSADYVYVTLIGHSMGTLVSYDVLYGFSETNKQMRRYFGGERPTFNWPPICRYKIGLLNYYTTGSPLAFFALQRPDVRGRTEAHIQNPPTMDHESGEWVNFIDPQDVAAYPLEDVYDPHVVRESKLRDQKTKRDFDPFTAHEYWDDKVVIQTIGDKTIQDYHTLIKDE